MVLGLILLVVQSSPKFYQFANNPVFHATGQTSGHKSDLSSGTGSPNFRSCNFLSLDKRYDCKQMIALISPVFRAYHLPQEVKTEICFILRKPDLNVIPTTFRRGPPFL
ncbi:MAG TPA: hypothetical protein VK518_06720 [Puia sp.]|nr:hypothetical protein [Puia sp.]